MKENQRNTILLYITLFFYAAFDGWRDAIIGHDWFYYHIIKWIAFYPLPIYVLLSQGYLKLANWKKLLWLAAGGFFFWEMFYMMMS